MKIAILSDTHGMLHEKALDYLRGVDEIWHGGDIGPVSLINQLVEIAPIRAVSGNADPTETKYHLPLTQLFECEGMTIMIHHIVGRPGRYTPEAKALVVKHRPQVLVCGHSHILLVAPGKEVPNLLHINPGAAGHHGFHNICTLLLAEIKDGKIKDLKAAELGSRGRLKSVE